MDRLTPDVFTRRVALIATVAAQWTFENVTTADAYDGKLPGGAAERFIGRIRSILDDMSGLLAPSPPDGAAEREARRGLVKRIADRIEALTSFDGDMVAPMDRQVFRALIVEAIGQTIQALDPLPTPAPTEAPAAGDGEAAIATRMALCREFVAQQSASSEWKDGAATGFYAGWNAALAARPAAVTEAMVEAAARVWHGDGSWESFPPSTIAAYRQSCRKALTAALAAGAAP